ncbi:hypothetical protein HJG60_010979 [Phyllostomus discolor]|uniref:Uncharacterized protein n=1 Tax=Phyllostomus discolor TaxID=89673 RepID=A0A834EAJ1_9CHIR|nr:hypothetical protein HJG60_010979 [Phyllostomus discolor]
MGPTLCAADARAEGPVSATVRTSLSPECDEIFWRCGVLAVYKRLSRVISVHVCVCVARLQAHLLACRHTCWAVAIRAAGRNWIPLPVDRPSEGLGLRLHRRLKPLRTRRRCGVGSVPDPRQGPLKSGLPEGLSHPPPPSHLHSAHARFSPPPHPQRWEMVFLEAA